MPHMIQRIYWALLCVSMFQGAPYLFYVTTIQVRESYFAHFVDELKEA